MPPPRLALRCCVCGLLRGTGTNPARAAEAAVRHEHDYRVTFGEPAKMGCAPSRAPI
jgi:hypothetical protein